MKRLAIFVACLSLISGLTMVPGFAGGGGLSGGAKEWTQLANKGLLADQISQMNTSLSHEIRMLENDLTMITDMLHNTALLPGQMLGTFMSPIQRLITKYNEIQGLLGKLSNIDEAFYNTFYSSIDANKSGTSPWAEQNYSEQYFVLSEQVEGKATELIKSLKVSADDVNDSAKLLADLSKIAANADGRNAILQAGNEMLGFIGGELVKIRSLMLEQTQTYLMYAERERSIQDAGAWNLEQDLENWRQHREAAENTAKTYDIRTMWK